VAVLSYREEPGNAQIIGEVEKAGKALGVQLDKQDVAGTADMERAFQAIAKSRADGVLVLHASVFIAQRKQMVDLGNRSRLPAMYPQVEFVDAGGLMTYGVNPNDLFRRAATYVDKILKGRKPSDLPVEQPTKFEFIVNLKAAKQIGLTIPPNVLVRADRVIR
jgi:putative ABC transport system substrate-binding protein